MLAGQMHKLTSVHATVRCFMTSSDVMWVNRTDLSIGSVKTACHGSSWPCASEGCANGRAAVSPTTMGAATRKIRI